MWFHILADEYRFNALLLPFCFSSQLSLHQKTFKSSLNLGETNVNSSLLSAHQHYKLGDFIFLDRRIVYQYFSQLSLHRKIFQISAQFWWNNCEFFLSLISPASRTWWLVFLYFQIDEYCLKVGSIYILTNRLKIRLLLFDVFYVCFFIFHHIHSSKTVTHHITVITHHHHHHHYHHNLVLTVMSTLCLRRSLSVIPIIILSRVDQWVGW